MLDQIVEEGNETEVAARIRHIQASPHPLETPRMLKTILTLLALWDTVGMLSTGRR